MGKLAVYSASAGAGKTYTIAKKYISMMLSSEQRIPDEPFRNILAVTFTNKACEEMKSRIVDNLFKISSDNRDEKTNSLIRDIVEDLKNENPDSSEEYVIKRSRSIFNAILHDYSYFSIYTIDTFFQKIIRNMTYELGARNNYEVELENSLVIEGVAEDIIQKAADDANLKKTLLGIIEKNVDANKKWSPNTELSNFLQSALFVDNYNYACDNDVLDKYDEQLESVIKDFPSKVKQVVKDFNVVIGSCDQSALNLISLKQYKKLSDNNFDSYLGKIFLKNSFGDVATKLLSQSWFKKDKGDDAVFSGCKNNLENLLKDSYKKFVTAFAIQESIPLMKLLVEAKKQLNNVLEESNIMLLDEGPVLLSKLLDAASSNGSVDVMPFVFEKVGTTYNKILIDEFQDTSLRQWNIFKALIEESISTSENTAGQIRSIIVGDAKQSIYGWRGGDWTILKERIGNQEFKDYVPMPLDNNFRTGKTIVNFNNTLFRELAKKESPYLPPDIDLSSLYSDVHQNAKNDAEGFVEVKMYESETKKKKELGLEIVLQMINDIEVLQQNGVGANQIMILIRGNNEAKEIANVFYNYPNRKEGVNYNVVSVGALNVSSNNAVKIIVSFLRYVINANDTLAFCEAAYLYYLEKNNIDYLQQVKIELETIKEQFTNDLGNLICECHSLQLFEIVEFLIKNLNLNKDRNVPFIVAFRDIVHKFSSKSTDIFQFLQYWDERGANEKLTLSENQDAIRITTIHKSKGLESDYIFIPFCDWEISKKKNSSDYIWLPSSACTETQNDDVNVVPIQRSASLKYSFFEKEYTKLLTSEVIESINILYVALTRPKYGLYVYARPVSNSVQGIIQSFMENMSQNLDANEETSEEAGTKIRKYVIGEPEYRRKKEEFSSRPFDEYNIYLPKYSIKTKINREYNEQIKKGNLYHAVFENIKTKDDLEPTLNQMFIGGEITLEERKELSENIAGKLTQQPFAEWYSPKYKVFNEFSILRGNELRRSDRVMVSDDEVIILDYKFGDNELAEHRKQVLNYKSFLLNMGYKNISTYIWYFFKDKLVKVENEETN